MREQAQGTQAHIGTAFEVLAKNLLQWLPIRKNTFRDVGVGDVHVLGQNIGIDLGFESTKGGLYGIHAKNRGHFCVVRSHFVK